MDPRVLKRELNTIRDWENPNQQSTVVSVAAADAEASLLFLCLRFGGDPNIVLNQGDLDRGQGTILDINGFYTCDTDKKQNPEKIPPEKYIILRAQGAKYLDEMI